MPFGMIGSFVSGLLGSESQKDTNKTNAEINAANRLQSERQFRENMAWSREQFDRTEEYNKWALANQQDFSREMWSKNAAENQRIWKQNAEYNSASAQRQRLEAAGLNPNLMMNGGSAGQGQGYTNSDASSPSALGMNSAGLPSNSVPSMIPMQASGAEGFMAHLLDNLFNFELKKNQAKQAGEEVKNMELQNRFFAAQAMADLALKKANVRGMDAKSALDRQMHAFNAATWDSDIERHKWDAMGSEAQTRMLYALETLYDSQSNKVLLECYWLPREARARINVATSQVALNAALEGQAKSQAKLATERALNEELADKRLMSPKQRKDFVNSVVEKAYWDVQTQMNNSGPNSYVSFLNSLRNQLDESEYNTRNFVDSLKSRTKERIKRKLNLNLHRKIEPPKYFDWERP